MKLLKDDRVLRQTVSKSRGKDRGIPDEAGILRAKELLQAAHIDCVLHDLRIINHGNGFGFRISSNDADGHLIGYLSDTVSLSGNSFLKNLASLHLFSRMLPDAKLTVSLAYFCTPCGRERPMDLWWLETN